MRITISMELNPNNRVPQWLADAIHHAERTGAKITISTGKVVQRQERPVKP